LWPASPPQTHGGAAFAHECFNASTSENGTAAEQQECFTPATLAAMGDAIALGIGPARGTDSVIALDSPNTGDGRGIDHLFPVLVGVALDCGYELEL
jgi:hypothetical protein